MDQRKIRCFATPDLATFDRIIEKVRGHLAAGGHHSRIPHANQLWMLVGFALFERLRREWECIEVFPQAIARTLEQSGVHKAKAGGVSLQLAAASRHTGWPTSPKPVALRTAGYGRVHDVLDAYLAAWVASLESNEREALGSPPTDVIWIPRLNPA